MIRARAQALLDEPDAHGQAALLLAESTLHALIENGTFTVAKAVEVTETAAEVKLEIATLAGESHGRMQASLDLLTKIRDSLQSDGNTSVQWNERN